MITVKEAAARAGRNPETVRRWIRSGRLPATKVGTQHVIDDDALSAVLLEEGDVLPAPASWGGGRDPRMTALMVQFLREDRELGH